MIAACNLQAAEIECSLSLFEARLGGNSNYAPWGRVHVRRRDRGEPHAKIYSADHSDCCFKPLLRCAGTAVHMVVVNDYCSTC